MNFLIVGGDDRLAYTAKRLCETGHGVRCFALNTPLLPEAVERTETVGAADCVVLPVPAEGRLGALNAPHAERVYPIADVLGSLPAGTLVCGGKLSPRIRAEAEKRGLRLFDYMARPEFTVGNAAITAEGAVAELMAMLKRTLSESCVLVIGYGRIGKLLAHKLRGLNAEVCVMSRNTEARALAEGMGIQSLAPDCAAQALGAFDAVVNTAPAPVLPSLSPLRHDCILLELASAPGGLDAQEAQSLGLSYAAAPGLPGRYAPQTAGGLICESVMNIVRENGI